VASCSPTIVSLDDAKTSAHGVAVKIKEVQFAPSSMKLLYETGFTDEKLEKVEGNIQLLEKKYGKEIVRSFTNYGSTAQYHIENEHGKTIYRHDENNSFTEEEHDRNLASYQGRGHHVAQLGRVEWSESFIPQQEDSKLTFFLDGVGKTVPADFSVTIKSKELKKILFHLNTKVIL